MELLCGSGILRLILRRTISLGNEVVFPLGFSVSHRNDGVAVGRFIMPVKQTNLGIVASDQIHNFRGGTAMESMGSPDRKIIGLHRYFTSSMDSKGFGVHWFFCCSLFLKVAG